MATYPFVKIGIAVDYNVTWKESIYEKYDRFATYKLESYSQILLTLMEHLLLYSKKFDKGSVTWTGKSYAHRNGTRMGLMGHLNRSEIDIGFPIHLMKEENMEYVDFTYLFQFGSHTFITRKPEYEPQIWDIFKIISLPVWIAILLSLFAMLLLCYVKPKHSFDKILLHLWAVFLRHNSIVNPQFLAEKFLIFSWVFGAIFFCLAYESVFLSFLSVSPVNKIKDVSELAKRIENGEYHCLCQRFSSLDNYITHSNEKYLKIIGQNILKNEISDKMIAEYFVYNSQKQNLALFWGSAYASDFQTNFFVSEDHIFERTGALIVRKGFCCKKLLETFVHRMMAFGLYFRYGNNERYFNRLTNARMSPIQEKSSNRKITLTDVAPAFIFLLVGHFLASLVFIPELLSKR